MKNTTRYITTSAVLIGISIVLTRITSIRIAIGDVEGIRLGLGSLPIIIAGFIMGPKWGGMVGTLSDLIGYLVNPMGAYLPFITLSAALLGIIPVLPRRLFRLRLNNFWSILCLVGLGQVVSSLIVTPLSLHYSFGIPFTILMPPRYFALIIQLPFYAMIIKAIFSNPYFQDRVTKPFDLEPQTTD